MNVFRKINAGFFLLAMISSSANAGTWQNVSQVPAMLPSASAAVINGQIYVLSGTVGHGLRNFFEVYDPIDDGWRPLSPMPADIYDYGVAATGNRLMVTGGRDRQSGEAVKSAWLYVANSAIWVEVESLPQAEFGHAMINVGSEIYLIGTSSGKLLRFDNVGQNWDIVSDLPASTSSVSVATDGRSIFIGADKGRVWRYDTQKKEWANLPSLPQKLSAGALLYLKDRVHYIGGVNANSETASENHWVLVGREWKAAEALPQRRHNMAYAVIGETAYIIGGASGSGFFSFFTGSDYLYKYED